MGQAVAGCTLRCDASATAGQLHRVPAAIVDSGTQEFPPLELEVERGESVRDEELSALEREIQDELHAVVKVRPAITWLAPNALERAVKKTQLLEKHCE